MRVIPSLDLLNGALVRLQQGKKEAVLRYEKEPLAWAREIQKAGFSLVHIVDLNGALEGERKHDSLILEIMHALGLAVQTGGGLRSWEDVKRVQAAGIGRIVLSTLLFEPLPSELPCLQKLVAALDVRKEEVRIKGWQERAPLSLWEALKKIQVLGIPRVLITDISRDGMLSAANIELYRKVKATFPELYLQASGGVTSREDLALLKDGGIDEVIVGRALYEGHLTLRDLKDFDGT